jgi:iron(III) transport system substrate-binding protein
MSRITRRHFIAASTVAASAGRATAAEPPPSEHELYEAAKQEGELTWYSAQIQSEPGEAAARAFTEHYPGVKVNVVRSTSEVAFQWLSADIRAGARQCDLFSSTDYSHFLDLKTARLLASFRPKNVDGMLPQLRDPDPDQCWQILYLGLYLLAYNTRKVAKADAPKSWKDLLDPKWKDQLAVGHPGYSGAIAIMAVILRKLYGWDYFTALEKNKPQIGRSSDDPVTLMNAGERNVGLGVSITCRCCRSRAAIRWRSSIRPRAPSPSTAPAPSPRARRTPTPRGCSWNSPPGRSSAM